MSEPLAWLPAPPLKPGVYIGVACRDDRNDKTASLYHWDGKVFQHFSGFYDHAITH